MQNQQQVADVAKMFGADCEIAAENFHEIAVDKGHRSSAVGMAARLNLNFVVLAAELHSAEMAVEAMLAPEKHQQIQ